MRYKTRKENKKQAEKKGKATQTSSAGRPSPWFLPQSHSFPSSPLHPSAHKAHRTGRSSSVPCSLPLDPKELSRRVRRSVDLELERCRQQAGFPVIKEKEESSPSASEADLDADEWPEPTQEEWRQVRVARCCSLRFGGIRTDQGFQKQEPVSSSCVNSEWGFFPALFFFSLRLEHPRRLLVFAS